MLNTDILREAGFSPDEIQQVSDEWESASKGDQVDHTAALIVLNEKPMWVCWTIAEMLDKLRPGCWLKPGTDEGLRVATKTTWEIAKNGVSLALTPEDVVHLLEQVLWSDHLLVFDWRSRRLGSGPDEIGVSLNGSAIQVTLHDDEADGGRRQGESADDK